jgi:hypothetical protein
MKMPARSKAQRKSAQGFVLLLIILSILTIGAITVLVALGTAATNSGRQAQQHVASASILQSTKHALIGYSLSPPASIGNTRPGILPTPDSLANGIYDGKEDVKCLQNTVNGLPGVGAASLLKRCLGKFPWKDLGLDIGSPEPHDALGDVPWLAVSANLVSNDSCLFVLNSEIANLTSPSTPTCSPGPWPYVQPTVLPHPWLSVYDENGTLVSDKVAAVFIIPGSPITTETRSQIRAPASPGNPSDYLDSIKLPLGCIASCTVFDNAGFNNKFVAIAPGTRYPNNAANVAVRNQLVPFNDHLVFITVDELMYHIERRVVGEMAKAMQIFKARPVNVGLQTYPWLQPLSTIFADSTSLYSQVNTTFGSFPFLMEYVAGASNIPFYRTDFSWSTNSNSETNDTGGSVPICIQVNAGTGNNRWMKNPLAGSLTGINPYSSSGPFKSGSASVSDGTCKWLGGAKLNCVSNMAPIIKSMTLWSSQGSCDVDNAVTAGTLTVALLRTITLSSTLCDAAAVNANFLNASNTSVHRWNFACSAVKGESSISVQDSISTVIGVFNKLPQTVSIAANPGIAHTLSVADMRYAPLMPEWFYNNRWYLTAFAALAPTAGVAPAAPSPNPCAPAASLTVGGDAGKGVVVMLSGKKLSTQTRPTNVVADYLESTNASGASSCSFANFAAPVPATFNDSLLVVTP